MGTAEEACEAFCDVDVQCAGGGQQDLEDCYGDCVYYEGAEAPCEDAALGLYACLVQLSCAEIEDYWAEVGDPYPCQPEAEVELAACR
jgi:hypothetical protein